MKFDTIYKGWTDSLHVTYYSGVNYLWTPSNSLDNALSSDPIASPLVTTIYYVTITDQYGCNKTDSVIIYVIDGNCREPFIFVPNAFTPNEDGVNDRLYVKGDKVIESLHFSIFDRWGEKVFESNNIKSFWDGKYKGKYCQPGVFVYYLEATCKDKNTYTNKGNITLIR